ncbi:hypothetical protein BC628DRAFT_935574 [Trametes gibbosa]|nr:hypothetical protein BC628DRAFT_935574 [Trametes gibbosa]
MAPCFVSLKGCMAAIVGDGQVKAYEHPVYQPRASSKLRHLPPTCGTTIAPTMQSYSHPDVFLCPLYNPPGVSDPISSIISGESELWPSSGSSTPKTSRSTSPATSSYSTPPTSPENSPSPPSTPSRSPQTPASMDESKKLQNYRRMCARTGKPLLDFVTELQSQKSVHEKREQLHASQSSRNPSASTRAGGSARC